MRVKASMVGAGRSRADDMIGIIKSRYGWKVKENCKTDHLVNDDVKETENAVPRGQTQFGDVGFYHSELKYM